MAKSWYLHLTRTNKSLTSKMKFVIKSTYIDSCKVGLLKTRLCYVSYYDCPNLYYDPQKQVISEKFSVYQVGVKEVIQIEINNLTKKPKIVSSYVRIPWYSEFFNDRIQKEIITAFQEQSEENHICFRSNLLFPS